MLAVHSILGASDEQRFRGRRVERLLLDSAEATKRILRRSTDEGTDVAISLPRGAYLADGAVVADDGNRIVVVQRAPESALVISFPPQIEREYLIEAAVSVGHAFGNQHVPVEIDGDQVRVPITASSELARATLNVLGLRGVSAEVAMVPLGCRGPLWIGHAH